MGYLRDNKWVYGGALGALAATLTWSLLARDADMSRAGWHIVAWNFETWRAGLNGFVALFVAGVVAYSAVRRSTFLVEKSLLLVGVAFGLSFLVGMISYVFPYNVFGPVFAWIIGVGKFGLAIFLLIAAWSFFYVLILGPTVDPQARASIFQADVRTKAWVLGWTAWSVATLILAVFVPL